MFLLYLCLTWKPILISSSKLNQTHFLQTIINSSAFGSFKCASASSLPLVVDLHTLVSNSILFTSLGAIITQITGHAIHLENFGLTSCWQPTKQTDSRADKQADRRADKRAGKFVRRLTWRQTHRKTSVQTNGQTDRQTYWLTDNKASLSACATTTTTHLTCRKFALRTNWPLN